MQVYLLKRRKKYHQWYCKVNLKPLKHKIWTLKWSIYIIYRHRVDCCINKLCACICLLCHQLLTCMVWRQNWIPVPRPTKNWSRQNLVRFQPNQSKLGSVLIIISPTIWFNCSVVHFYPLIVSKKIECLFLEKVLDQTWFEFYFTISMLLYLLNGSTD